MGKRSEGLTAATADEVTTSEFLNEVGILLLAIRTNESNIQVRPKSFFLGRFVRIRAEGERHLRGRHRLV